MQFRRKRYLDPVLAVALRETNRAFHQAIDALRKNAPDDEHADCHCQQRNGAGNPGNPHRSLIRAQRCVVVRLDPLADLRVKGRQLVVRGRYSSMEPLQGGGRPARVRLRDHRDEFRRLPVGKGPVVAGAAEQCARLRFPVQGLLKTGEFGFDPFAQGAVGGRGDVIFPLGEFIDRRQRLPYDEPQMLDGRALLALARRDVVEGGNDAAVEQDKASERGEEQGADGDEHAQRDPGP